MKASLKVMEYIQKNLKTADNSIDTAELEDFADVIVEMLETETTDDLLETGDTKLKEILDYANGKIADIEGASKISKSDIFGINNDNLEIIKLLKQDNLGIIAGLSKLRWDALNCITDDFKSLNDVPKNSTICTKLAGTLEKCKFLNTHDLPFVFGILSRYDDYYDGFSSALGTWYNSNADTMLGLLTGCHEYTTQYAGFYVEPKLSFFQGSRGNFIKKKCYIKHQYSTSIYKYPYAALGCLFVKNKTASNITSTLNFGGTSYGGTAGGGSSIFVGIPDHMNSVITWTNVYSYSSSNSGIASSASITIPANKLFACCFIHRAITYQHQQMGHRHMGTMHSF